MQRSTSSGTSDSVSCCSDKVSPALPAAFWMAWTQPRKSSFLSPWMYSVLPASPASVGGGPAAPHKTHCVARTPGKAGPGGLGMVPPLFWGAPDTVGRAKAPQDEGGVLGQGVIICWRGLTPPPPQLLPPPLHQNQHLVVSLDGWKGRQRAHHLRERGVPSPPSPTHHGSSANGSSSSPNGTSSDFPGMRKRMERRKSGCIPPSGGTPRSIRAASTSVPPKAGVQPSCSGQNLGDTPIPKVPPSLGGCPWRGRVTHRAPAACAAGEAPAARCPRSRRGAWSRPGRTSPPWLAPG